jgi:hypothetical protein
MVQPAALSHLLTQYPRTGSIARLLEISECRLAEESIMTDCDRSSGLERRAFLGRAASAGVASVLAPRAALGQTSVPTVPSAPSAAITIRAAEHLVGSAVSHAYAVKAGPFVFLNGHEG